MSKYKLSPWHYGSVKTINIGPYEVYCKCCGNVFFSYFDGVWFKNTAQSPEACLLGYKHKVFDSALIVSKWRGILKDQGGLNGRTR